MRRPSRPLVVLLAAATAVALAAAPVVAKEGLEARLDAPIPMGVPGGTELLVGVTVTVLTDEGPRPVEGTPVYLKLVGQDGSTTRAAGEADRAPGHYTMRIAMPEGGARDVEIGVHGTSDLAMIVMDVALTMGGVTATTAQLAPPLAPALTPFPRAAATVAPAEPAAVAPVAGLAPQPDPPTPVAQPGAAAIALIALGGAVVALAGAGLVVGRRRRAADLGRSAPSTTRSA